MLETRIFDTETPEFLAVNPHFYGREGFGFKRTWPNFGRGTRLAFYMMELAVALGCSATFLDLIQLLEVPLSDSLGSCSDGLQEHKRKVHGDSILLHCVL